ncbi:HEAT repeat domain-containing protein [Streptomyces niveus]|uniref:HEAT repeat domain-containing protein n=1 Tax=Streptomyces niveus TaxID=193462 RepID=UPI0033E0B4AB
MALDAVDAIRQLQDRSSAKRRSAAKQLRKLGDPNAGPALLEALKNEVRDSRTWETQYQMTMALGTCGSPSDLPYLRDLVLQRETLHAVHTAGGDAIVRLSHMEHSHAEAIRWCLTTGNETLVGGALQAVAMLRLAPDQETVTDVLDFIEAKSCPVNDLRVVSGMVDHGGDRWSIRRERGCASGRCRAWHGGRRRL